MVYPIDFLNFYGILWLNTVGGLTLNGSYLLTPLTER